MALDSYPDADDFILHLNSAIQGLRNVTFVLQNEMKGVIDDAERWYDAWREQMKADPVMEWLNDSRVQVVHRGDLETHSTARVGLLADWYGTRPIMEFDVPPFVSPHAVAVAVAGDLDLPEEIRREGLLVVERRWVEARLPDWELLDALAHCYGVVSQVLADAHQQCGSRMLTVEAKDGNGPRELHRDHLGGRLPCMVASSARRTARMHLASGDLLTSEEVEIPFDPENFELTAREHYGLGEEELEQLAAGARNVDDSFLRQGAFFADLAKRLLVKDGAHATIAFLYGPDGATAIRLEAEDQAQKYLAIQRVADKIRVNGADRLIYIAEVWEAAEDSLEPGQRPRDFPERTEALWVLALSAEGPEASRQWYTPFSRGPSEEIVLGETTSGWIAFPQFLMPVLMAWEEMWPTPPGDTRD